ncbi:hypothetical protein J437_LFUL002930 [Ladona fulva]|uniref:HEAT repeat-containing protein 2 n=1 Tax=Ladona fulva TaxID=123851 RepID=A0A8K0P4S6_LADFU|nr:hypothetical protein J437_LFUL002930 [Ladona fulva]
MGELGKTENIRIMRNVNLLTSSEKIKRKNALLDISKELFGEGCCLVNEEELNNIFCDISISLLKTLSDDAEICRELGISLIRNFLLYLPVHEKYLSKVMPYLSQRIGDQKIIEPSEEIRLLLIQLLSLIVDRYGVLLSPYLNELVKILSNTVLDPYPVVKRESCECISLVANSLSKQFHLQSESLVKPTVNALTHQHYKVRLSAVNAISDIIRYGNSKSVDDVIGPLAERLFDSNSNVRLAVARAAGNWLLNFSDRYSYFHKILPLILTCLMDEIPDVKDKTLEYWESAGKQYETENDEELKDVKNYSFSTPSHYPQIARPRLGCRILVKNNFSKILPALIKELGDWTSEVRLKSACLLYQLILHLENNVTLNLEKVLTGMYFAAGDEEESIVKQVEKSAELIGYFVPPDVYCGLRL